MTGSVAAHTVLRRLTPPSPVEFDSRATTGNTTRTATPSGSRSGVQNTTMEYDSQEKRRINNWRTTKEVASMSNALHPPSSSAATLRNSIDRSAVPAAPLRLTPVASQPPTVENTPANVYHSKQHLEQKLQVQQELQNHPKMSTLETPNFTRLSIGKRTHSNEEVTLISKQKPNITGEQAQMDTNNEEKNPKNNGGGSQHNQSQTSRQQNIVKWKRAFHKWVFYFDGEDVTREGAEIAQYFRELGAKVQVFMDKTVTHIVVPTPKDTQKEGGTTVSTKTGITSMGKSLAANNTIYGQEGTCVSPFKNVNNDTSNQSIVNLNDKSQQTSAKPSRSTQHWYSIAKNYKIKIWTLDAAQRIMNTLRGAKGESRPSRLQDHLRNEKLYGLSTNRDPDQSVHEKSNWYTFKGKYLLVEELSERYRPIMIKEYKDYSPKKGGKSHKSGDKGYPPWPQLSYHSREGRCAFVKYPSSEIHADELNNKIRGLEGVSGANSNTVAARAAVPLSAAQIKKYLREQQLRDRKKDNQMQMDTNRRLSGNEFIGDENCDEIDDNLDTKYNDGFLPVEVSRQAGSLRALLENELLEDEFIRKKARLTNDMLNDNTNLLHNNEDYISQQNHDEQIAIDTIAEEPMQEQRPGIAEAAAALGAPQAVERVNALYDPPQPASIASGLVSASNIPSLSINHSTATPGSLGPINELIKDRRFNRLGERQLQLQPPAASLTSATSHQFHSGGKLTPQSSLSSVITMPSGSTYNAQQQRGQVSFSSENVSLLGPQFLGGSNVTPTGYQRLTPGSAGANQSLSSASIRLRSAPNVKLTSRYPLPLAMLDNNRGMQQSVGRPFFMQSTAGTGSNVRSTQDQLSPLAQGSTQTAMQQQQQKQQQQQLKQQLSMQQRQNMQYQKLNEQQQQQYQLQQHMQQGQTQLSNPFLQSQRTPTTCIATDDRISKGISVSAGQRTGKRMRSESALDRRPRELSGVVAQLKGLEVQLPNGCNVTLGGDGKEHTTRNQNSGTTTGRSVCGGERQQADDVAVAATAAAAAAVAAGGGRGEGGGGEEGIGTTAAATVVFPRTHYKGRAGYCENCGVKFDVFEQHVASRAHRTWARANTHFGELDILIAKMARQDGN